VNFNADNAGSEDRGNFQGQEASGCDPYVVNIVNQGKAPQKKERLSESMSAVLDELGDRTVSRRATLLRMHRKD
jgi:hypothetical protein